MPQMDDFWEEELFYFLILSFSGFLIDDSTADLLDDDDEFNVALINII